jgi:hypothetical protein
MAFNDNVLLNQCSVYIGNTYNTTGTLTKSKLRALSAADKIAIFTTGSQWTELNSYFLYQFEMAANGVKRNGFYDWIMSSQKPGLKNLINVRKMQQGASLIEPFIMGRQISHVFTDFWTISNAWAKGDSGEPSNRFSSGLAYEFILKIVPPQYNGQNLNVLDPAWFAPKQIVLTINATGASYNYESQYQQFKVLEANTDSDSSPTALLIAVVSAQSGAIISSANVLKSGILLPSINNVSDYESWCQNPANYRNIKHVPFWYQTYRTSRSIDSLYKELYAKLLRDNKFYAEFVDLPISERIRQDEDKRQKEFINAFLFQKALPNQDLTNWPNLEKIYAANASTKGDSNLVFPFYQSSSEPVIGYRANMVGVREQLAACGRVKDYSGGTMVLYKPSDRSGLIDKLYEIYRARESSRATAGGANANVIDVYTNSYFAEYLEQAIIDLWKAKYGTDTLRITVNVENGYNEWGFSWKTFKLPVYNIILNVITHKALDDIQLFFSNEFNEPARGNFLMVLDLGQGGTIYPAVLGSNRRVVTNGRLDDLARIDKTFACRMATVTEEITLYSETVTAIVEAPENSYWVENFAMAKPTIVT